MKYTIPIKKEHYYKASLLIFNQLGLSLTELEFNLLYLASLAEDKT